MVHDMEECEGVLNVSYRDAKHRCYFSMKTETYELLNFSFEKGVFRFQEKNNASGIVFSDIESLVLNILNKSTQEAIFVLERKDKNNRYQFFYNSEKTNMLCNMMKSIPFSLNKGFLSLRGDWTVKPIEAHINIEEGIISFSSSNMNAGNKLKIQNEEEAKIFAHTWKKRKEQTEQVQDEIKQTIKNEVYNMSFFSVEDYKKEPIRVLYDVQKKHWVAEWNDRFFMDFSLLHFRNIETWKEEMKYKILNAKMKYTLYTFSELFHDDPYLTLDFISLNRFVFKGELYNWKSDIRKEGDDWTFSFDMRRTSFSITWKDGEDEQEVREKLKYAYKKTIRAFQLSDVFSENKYTDLHFLYDACFNLRSKPREFTFVNVTKEEAIRAASSYKKENFGQKIIFLHGNNIEPIIFSYQDSTYIFKRVKTGLFDNIEYIEKKTSC